MSYGTYSFQTEDEELADVIGEIVDEYDILEEQDKSKLLSRLRSAIAPD